MKDEREAAPQAPLTERNIELLAKQSAICWEQWDDGTPRVIYFGEYGFKAFARALITQAHTERSDSAEGAATLKELQSFAEALINCMVTGKRSEPNPGK